MTPFLLLSMARSGTQYVADLLRHHPHITQHGEVLNPMDDVVTDYDLIWRCWRQPEHVTQHAVGITILQEQLAPRPLFLPRLLDMPGMRVIVVERIDQLGRLRSVHQAAARWDWSVDKPATDLPTVELHPGQTLRSLQAATIWHNQLAQIGNPLLWLYYEHIQAHQTTLIDAAYQFLGAHPHTPTTATVKQEHRPLADTVTNLDAIADTLAGTRYEPLLKL